MGRKDRGKVERDRQEGRREWGEEREMKGKERYVVCTGRELSGYGKGDKIMRDNK